MKRVILTLLIISLMTAVLGACGSPKSGDGSGNAPSAEMIYKHSPAPSDGSAVTPEILNGRRGFTAVGSETKMPEVR